MAETVLQVRESLLLTLQEPTVDGAQSSCTCGVVFRCHRAGVVLMCDWVLWRLRGMVAAPRLRLPLWIVENRAAGV